MVLVTLESRDVWLKGAMKKKREINDNKSMKEMEGKVMRKKGK